MASKYFPPLYPTAHRSSGVPTYRKKVAYVPQRSPILPGTPRDFVTKILSLTARSDEPMSSSQNIIDLGAAWSLDHNLWDREWANLSGGESQRIALAVALGLNTAEVLLLDGQYLAHVLLSSF